MKKYIPSILKWLVVVLAIGNLIFLFIFDYQLPGFLRPLFGDSGSTIADVSAESQEPASTSDASIQIVVPTEPLNYNGSGNLNLMDGVVVTDDSGAELTDISVFSSIKAGSSRREKIIEYSATDDSGVRVTTERILSLGDNYTGPKIEVLGDMPELTEDELPSLMNLLISSGLIHADDGFGQDVTSAIVSSIKSEPDISGNTIVTLTITNIVNDSYSTDITITTKLDGPVIRLTTDHVTLEEGESFNFYNYIDSAFDAEGNDLFSYISVNGSVDTSTPGEYTVEFFCTDSEGNRSAIKTLTVTVQ